MSTAVGFGWVEWLLTGLVTMAALLQIANARIASDVELVRAGRALLAGGWVIASAWFWWRLADGVRDVALPLPAQLWIGMVALGTVCVCLYRINDEMDVPSRSEKS